MASAAGADESSAEVEKILDKLRQIAEPYVTQADDTLFDIVRREDLQTDWRFLARLNDLQSEEIEGEQKLLLVRGTFHLRVEKRHHRAHLQVTTSEGDHVLGSFHVGLGENGSTPAGRFRVRPRSKVINPSWVNPRTQEYFEANAPDMPIGEYWIGIEGMEESTRHLQGYGIHGTNEPESIGQDASLGCIRMLEPGLALVYEVLVEEHSRVEIVE